MYKCWFEEITAKVCKPDEAVSFFLADPILVDYGNLRWKHLSTIFKKAYVIPEYHMDNFGL